MSTSTTAHAVTTRTPAGTIWHGLSCAFANSGAPANLANLRKQSNWLCVWAQLLLIPCAVVLGWWFKANPAVVLLACFPAAAAAALAFHEDEKPYSMVFQTALLISAVSFQIGLAGGLAAMHLGYLFIFTLFVLFRSPMLIAFCGGLVLAVYGASYLLGQSGIHFGVFSPSAETTPFIQHSFAIALGVALLSGIAALLRQQTREAEETAILLGHLKQHRGLDLSLKPFQAHPSKLSALGQVFNEYAENLGLTHSSYKMLNLDITELQSLASDLRSGQLIDTDNLTQCAAALRDLLEETDAQALHLETTVEGSIQLRKNLGDLVHELGHAMDLLVGISKQAFETNTSMQALVGETQPKDPDDPNDKAYQLLATASAVDHLSSRCQSFLSKFEMIKNGIDAVHTLGVHSQILVKQSLDQNRDNLKAGWTLLARMETHETETQQAKALLGELENTIRRTELASRQMKHRFSRLGL